MSCALTVAIVGAIAASEGLAVGPPRVLELERPGGLAIVDGGVLWSDEGALLLYGPHSVRRLGASRPIHDDFSSSATATAALVESDSDELDEEAHFVASVLPGRLHAIALPRRLSGGGCADWEPSGAYVVVEDDLVAAGECQEVTEHPERQPLYIRDLRGGRWRVLRWLTGGSAAELAAQRDLLAVGTHHFGRRMTVSILELSTGAVLSRFETPAGHLAFASPRRIVVEIPDHGTSTDGLAVSLRLYSTRGSYLANLGVMTEPLISGMHIVAYENGTLSVRSLTGGAARPVVGFNPPARRLRTFAFQWPKLVASETTSKPLLPSEVRCWSGSYGPSSKPFLATLDLARIEPFDAPPATVEVKPAAPLVNCGPAPPEILGARATGVLIPAE